MAALWAAKSRNPQTSEYARTHTAGPVPQSSKEDLYAPKPNAKISETFRAVFGVQRKAGIFKDADSESLKLKDT